MPTRLAGAGLFLLFLLTGLPASARDARAAASEGRATPAPAFEDDSLDGDLGRVDPEVADDPPGLWRRPTRPAAGPDAGERDAEQRRMIEQLEAIGYVDGSEAPPLRVGVTIHDRERALPGRNFYFSGHAAEARLIDMDGGELHRWSYAFDAIWPDRPLPPRRAFWRRARLLPDGSVIAIYEGWGIIKIDRDSKLVWANPIRAHHDLALLPNGDLWVLTRRAHLVPRVHATIPVLEDYATLLDADGQEKKSVSILEAMERSQWGQQALRAARKTARDVFHTNAISVLDGKLAGRLPFLKRGNLLLSMARLDALAVLDPDRQTIVRIWSGDWKAQHDPRILDNGHLLVFDNQGRDEASAVIELDPSNGETRWSYRGTPERPFYSEFCGASQRLANGNTLITESGQGRAFEVTSAGDIVWEFHNPHRAGENGEFVASLLELLRLPREFPTHWARGAVTAH